MTDPTPLYRGGTGVPLLLLHGATLTWRTWAPVLPMLEDHHDVIAMTLVGHLGGPSLDEGTPPSMNALVDGVERQLDRLGCDQVHIAGNSLGGWIALELVRRQRALSVTAFAPGGAWTSDFRYATRTSTIAILIAAMGVLGEHGDRLALSRVGRWIAGYLACENPSRMDPGELAEVLRTIRAAPMFTELFRALAVAPIRPLTAPSCPITFAWGRRDRIVPFRHFGKPLLERVPSAKLVMLDGVGHVPMLDAPHTVADIILDTAASVD